MLEVDGRERGCWFQVGERGFELAETQLMRLQLLGDDVAQVAEVFMLSLQGFLDRAQFAPEPVLFFAGGAKGHRHFIANRLLFFAGGGQRRGERCKLFLADGRFRRGGVGL